MTSPIAWPTGCTTGRTGYGDAQSDADYAEIWALSREFCPPVVREWVRVMMSNYKVTPRDLGLPPV
jgi:hypothetical protein